MIHLVYPEVADRLAVKVPALSWIDLDQEQFEFEGQEYPLPEISCLVNIDVPSWSDISGGVQRGDGLITVRLGVGVTEDTYQHSTQRGAAMNKLLLISQVHKALHHWQGENFSKLVRVSSRKEPSGEFTGRWIYTMVYKSVITDSGAVEEIQQAQVGLKTTPGERPAANSEEYII